MLGTLARERINVLKAEGRTWESRQRIKLARLKSLEALRSQYILLWGSLQKIEISEAFLTDEHQVNKVLQERNDAGFLLEADRQEFLTAFSLVRRNIANLIATQRRALQTISLLTNNYTDSFSPSTPHLPYPCLDRNVLRAAVVDHRPEIIILQGLIEEQLGVIKLAKHSDIKANVSMAVYGDIEYPSSQEGYGIRMQFSMDLPWEFSRAKRAEASAEQAALIKLQRRLNMVSGQLLADSEYYLQRYHASLENKRFAIQRVKTALEAVRERAMRKMYLAGDTFEQLQASRYQYYLAAMDYVDAEVIELQARVRLLAFHEEGERDQGEAAQVDSVINKKFLQPLWSQTRTTTVEDIPVLHSKYKRKHSEKKQGYGVYAWNSRKLFAQAKSDEAFWEKLVENKINKILLSFDRRQLDELVLPVGEKHLRNLIQEAKDKEICIGLLLGEPTWILPEHRDKLLQIVNRIQGMGFELIHLDLEPNQLEYTKLSEEYLLAHLLRTVQAVSRSTSLPVEVDLHPRYLDAKKYNFCLGCGLKNLDFVSVTLMAYVSDPRKVTAIVEPILEDYPEIPFSIAQSVEPQLSSKESYADSSKKDFHNALEELATLTNHKFQSIYIQSWQDYMDMHDEN